MITRKKTSLVQPRLWAAILLALTGLAQPIGLRAAGSKVLIVKSRAFPPFDQAAQEFKKCLDAKGVSATYVEVVLPDDPGQAEAALRATVAAKPDLVMTVGLQASQAVREKMANIPSIFCMVLDPAGNGLTKGGVSLEPSPRDYVEYIHRHFPQFKRIGILYNPQKLRGLINEFRQVNIAPHTFVFQEAASIGAIDGAIRDLQTKADCLLMVSDPTVYTQQTIPQILLQTIQLNLPFIALSAPFVKGGALAGLYADWKDNGCAAAELAAQVLQGQNPSSLPIVLPRKLNSAINLVVADRLKVTVPASARAAAEEIVR